MSESATLLCWHSANHGFEVLEKALKALNRKKISISHIIYLVQSEDDQIPDRIQNTKIERIKIPLDDPTRHHSIYEAVKDCVLPRVRSIENLHINISPGTPAMHSVMLILHAGGHFREETELWSSQYNPQTEITRIDRVNFPISTYMAEIHKGEDRNPDLAIYEIEAKSDVRKKALEQLARYATVPSAPILLLGERGTGKTRLVETYIKELKQRKNVVTVPCGTLDSSIADSTLFGHVKGAFTGADKDRKGLIAEADKGILFLDEVQDMPKSTQRKLVRVLQDREHRYRQVGSDKENQSDFDLVCASNIHINELRERLDYDLFDRISHLIVVVPPLRECREDIIHDWNNVWKEISLSDKYPMHAPLTEELNKQLNNHQLHGNFRDLQHLALLIISWWSRLSVEQAVHRALNDWQSPQTSLEHEQFGYGNHDERILWFKGRLAKWAKNKYGTWKRAATALSCDESTLRRNLRMYKAKRDCIASEPLGQIESNML